MKKNILRVVALLLIVCVLAGFPLKAKATEAVAYAALAVFAPSVVAGLFNCSGLHPGGDPQPFYDAVNQCISDLHLGEMIMGVSWAMSGFQRFAVPVTIAEQVRDWLWDSGTIFDGPPSSIGHSISCIYNGSEYSHSSDGMIGYFFIDLGFPLESGSIYHDYRFIMLSDNLYFKNAITNQSGTCSQNSAGQFFVLLSSSGSQRPFSGSFSGVTNLGSYVFSSRDELNSWWDSFLWFTPAVSDDFNSGVIADRMKTLTEGYPAWGEGIFSVDPAIVDSDEEEPIPYIPVGVGQTLEESASLTQEQAQSGVSTIEVSVEIPDDTVAGTKLSAFFSSLLSTLSWTSIKTWIEGIWTSVLSIPDKIAELPAAIAEKFTAFWTSVTTWLEDLHAGIISLPQAIADAFTNFWTTVTTWLESLYTGVTSIPQAIADVLADVFIPAEDYISVKVEALAAEYAFVPDIVDSVTLMKNNLVGDGGPPVIYVDFGRAGGSTNYGGKVLLTDFAWYEEYKPTVDALLSAALWAFFLWRVFLKLPGIIGGESAAVGSAVTSYTRRGRDD